MSSAFNPQLPWSKTTPSDLKKVGVYWILTQLPSAYT